MERTGTDRRIHASCPEMEVVRYNKAGKWYLEPKGWELPRQRVSLNGAVEYALWIETKRHGTVNLGLPGGSAFDRKFSTKADAWLADAEETFAKAGRQLRKL